MSYCLILEQTRNVLLLIFITIIMALVTSGLLYFLDQFLSKFTMLIQYTSKIHHVSKLEIR